MLHCNPSELNEISRKKIDMKSDCPREWSVILLLIKFHQERNTTTLSISLISTKMKNFYIQGSSLHLLVASSISPNRCLPWNLIPSELSLIPGNRLIVAKQEAIVCYIPFQIISLLVNNQISQIIFIITSTFYTCDEGMLIYYYWDIYSHHVLELQ